MDILNEFEIFIRDKNIKFTKNNNYYLNVYIFILKIINILFNK